MNPKHIILSAICVSAIVLTSSFLFALRKHNAKSARIGQIPDITLTTLDGTDFSLAKLKPERKVAILFFSPECEFCKKEMEGILNSRDNYSGIDWVFVTISSFEELDSFLVDYPIDTIDDARICIVDSPDLLIALDITSPPSLFIYDSDGHLEYSKHGAVSIKTILEWLK